MESFSLLALVGTVSTATLGGLSIFKRWRPYSLSVLGASVLVGLSVARQVLEVRTSAIELWLTCFFVMLGVQVLLAPVALVTFWVVRARNA